MTIVTLTDRLKLIRNRVIEVFGGVFILSLDFHFRWYGGFCRRTRSNIFLFLINNNHKQQMICITYVLRYTEAIGKRA